MGKHETRDQLADILYKEGAYCGNCDYEGRCSDCNEVLEGYATAIRKAGWRPPLRRVETAADADRLSIGTVVMNDGGQVAQRYDGAPVWWQVLDGDQVDSADLIGTGYITVLHDPNEVAQ